MEPNLLLYLYGVVPPDAPAPPPELHGLEDSPVRLLRESGLAAVVSDVPADEYSEEALEAHTRDLPWVGQRGVSHELVLTWFVDRGPVVPLAPFSLHRDEERVRTRLRDDAERFRAALARLRGAREWGVKIWRDDATLAEQIVHLSPRLRQLDEQIQGAPPGRQFLLRKKLDAARAAEMRTVAADLVRGVYHALANRAEAAVALPLPATPAEPRVLALHAAFLVRDEEFAAFQAYLSEAAHDHHASGLEFEFTGPWPAYHFAKADAA